MFEIELGKELDAHVEPGDPNPFRALQHLDKDLRYDHYNWKLPIKQWIRQSPAACGLFVGKILRGYAYGPY
jgi:hypothetical protein